MSREVVKDANGLVLIDDRLIMDHASESLLRSWKNFPAHGFRYFNDFMQETGTTFGDNQLVEVNSGGLTTANAGDATHPGVARMSTSTSATGRTALTSTTSLVLFGGGVWSFEALLGFNQFSTGTERYAASHGFIDTTGGIDQTDGAYFTYDEGGIIAGGAASPNWIACTASNSVRTFVNTGVAVVLAFQKTRIEVNAAGSLAQFYINDVLKASITTNIPVGTGRETGFGGIIQKSIGTTARAQDIDYINVTGAFITTR